MTEGHSGLTVEHTLLLEELEGILVQDLGPEIAVVACGVAGATEDVIEIGAAVTRDDFADEAHLLAALLLEFSDVNALDGTQLVPLHIQYAGCAELAGGEALVEIGSRGNPVHQLVRDEFAGLPVEGRR